jgi:hypothetical protein
MVTGSGCNLVVAHWLKVRRASVTSSTCRSKPLPAHHPRTRSWKSARSTRIPEPPPVLETGGLQRPSETDQPGPEQRAATAAGERGVHDGPFACRPSPRTGRRSSQRPWSYPGRPRHRRWWVRPTRRPVRQRRAKSRSARAAIMISATRSHARPRPAQARAGARAGAVPRRLPAGLDPDQLETQVLAPYLGAGGSALAAAQAVDQQHALDPEASETASSGAWPRGASAWSSCWHRLQTSSCRSCATGYCGWLTGPMQWRPIRTSQSG